ncbi:MAG: NUDIX hydrolase, partial [Nanoarchaeota archaeon]|nr:NUDIX hydrolase [Nanoarchaeota archaeon]
MKQKYRRSVFIVTYSIHHGRINYLILKRKWHWRGWEFPKGGIEDGEKMINAVKRETLEETGKAALQIKRYEIYGRYKYKKTLPDRPGFIGQSYV